MYEIGINLAFPPKRVNQAKYYEDIIKEMSRQGLTVFRLWLSDFSFNYYRYRGEEYDFNIDLLTYVHTLSAARGLKVIPVLFDFNEFNTTNIHWSDYEHTFQTSFINKFLKMPKDFFRSENIEIGLSKFFKVKEIFAEENIYAWELFNEIDLVKGFDLVSALDWATKFSTEIGRGSKKPIYLSFADPKYVDKSAGVSTDLKLAIHTYRWPYNEFYKNLIYWQNKYASHWVMEFGDVNASKSELLVALLASFILNRERQIAMPWFWDTTLNTNVYQHLSEMLDEISEYVKPGDNYEFTGDLGTRNTSLSYDRIRKTFKMSGLRGVISKAATIMGVSSVRPRGKCLLKFENERHRIVIDADFLQSPVSERDPSNLIRTCDIGGTTLKVFAKC